MSRLFAQARVHTVADDRYFAGAVALYNSLRLTGNPMPVTVVDAGLTPGQRAVLEPHVDLVAGPGDVPPAFLKTWAVDAFAEPIVCFLDADVAVTASFGGLLGRAAAGEVVAATDPRPARWFAEWATIYGLRAPLRHEPYRNSGVVVVDRRQQPDLVERWRACGGRVARVPVSTTGPDETVSPIWYRDQDAFNAVLMSEVPPGQVGPILDGVLRRAELLSTRVVDPARLRCRRGGHAVPFLHHLLSPKPWFPHAPVRLPENAYVRCLRRVLTGDDVAIRVPPALLVPWLRSGYGSGAVRRWRSQRRSAGVR